jgi:hypothetical protein
MPSTTHAPSAPRSAPNLNSGRASFSFSRAIAEPFGLIASRGCWCSRSRPYPEGCDQPHHHHHCHQQACDHLGALNGSGSVRSGRPWTLSRRCYL